MKYYSKISAPFKRDMSVRGHPLVLGLWARPEFNLLQATDWIFNEKVDGTSCVIQYIPPQAIDLGERGIGWEEPQILLGGHTSRSVIPEGLKGAIKEVFTEDKFQDFTSGVTLYGEGVGKKINGGGKYGFEGFVLFDVLVGTWWLTQDNVASIAQDMEIPHAPSMGHGTLWDAIDIVKTKPTSHFGDFVAEGIIARPALELTDRSGKRIITKVKVKDFT